MSLAIAIPGAIAAVALVFHVVSIGIAIWRCRSAREPVPAGPDAPLVSIIRPLCGEENFLADTLRSGFVLDYRRYELLFCVGTADDPAVPIARRLMDTYPHIPARILVGNEVISENPKLNNTYKGWRAAEADWVIMADSNVLMPPDYIQRLQRTWQSDTGLVCSPPVGCWPAGFWAEVECAFLNTYQARWQLAADGVGQGFAQGKNMLWRRRDLELWGGIRALGAELAEDAAGTKLVRAAGLRVRVVDAPFPQPLGGRDAAAVWKRQVRWARLRRAAFSSYFALEILVGSALPLLALTLAVLAADASPAWILAFAAFWYACEAVLARAVGWHMRAVSPLAWIARDLLLPALYVAGWAGSAFVWRGNEMRTAASKA